MKRQGESLPTPLMNSCPSCGRANLEIVETSHVWMSWNVRDGKLVSTEGKQGLGELLAVDGVCLDCLHMWPLRGIGKAADLFPEIEENIPGLLKGSPGIIDIID